MARKRSPTPPETELVSLHGHGRYLSVNEIRLKRIELALEMTALLLDEDTALPGWAREDLQGVGQTLEALYRVSKEWRRRGGGPLTED
jgi:hypothetical protein